MSDSQARAEVIPVQHSQHRLLDVRPLALGIGAEIHGVDLASDVDPSTVEAVRSTLLKWRVVFFRDQSFSPADHVEIARRFGDVLPGHPSLPGLDEQPEVLPLVSDPGRSADGGIESRWHTDVTFTPEPPMGSILHGITVPQFGGDTQWTNLVMAYERLSPALRGMLDDLHAVHRNTLHVARQGVGVDSALRTTFSATPRAAMHPVVRVHPETGERALFVNPGFTSHIVELSARESGGLLDLLYDHIARPEFTVRFRWSSGSVAFWDNRCTAHHAPTDIATATEQERAGLDLQRLMHRVVIRGDLPMGPNGERSRELDGAAFA